MSAPDTVAYDGVTYETDKAYLLQFRNEDGIYCEQWVPKSLMLEHDEDEQTFATYLKIANEYNNCERTI